MSLNETKSFKGFILTILTVLAIAFIGLSLTDSWGNPQPETKLDLLQTDLLLQVTEWQPQGDRIQDLQVDLQVVKDLLIGRNPQVIYQQSLKDYQQAVKSNQLANQLEPVKSSNSQQIIDELNTRTGLLQAYLGQTPAAIATWDQAIPPQSSITTTAEILKGLWSQPSLIFPDAESQIRKSLDGWFRHTALVQLYKVQQRPITEDRLQIQQEAESAIDRLILTSAVTVLGGALGVLVIIVLGVQRLFFAQSSPLINHPLNNGLNPSLNGTLNQISDQISGKLSVPWSLHKVWEVMVLWFMSYLTVSQILLPIALALLHLTPDHSWNYRDRAILVLIPYVLSMAPMLIIFRTSLQEFRPLPTHLFRFQLRSWQWLGWGIGGYLAAVPIVLIVSALSQQILQGQGGGNPLLPILVESQDPLAKIILWSTLAIAAPFFEELLFRGFLLPSLASVLPTGTAIALSGLGFAVVHLNLSDILPLTALGMVLGFVYKRSGNLLAPMLLHALWNSGTFLTLLALSSEIP